MSRHRLRSSLKHWLQLAAPGGGGGVLLRLTWTDNASDETGYTIERSTDGVSYAAIDSVAANTETYDNNVSPGATYYYRVRANNANGGSYSNVDSVTV